MEYNIPKDPMILLSYLNTQLRDRYSSLQELCMALNLSAEDLKSKMAGIDYSYDGAVNQFV